MRIVEFFEGKNVFLTGGSGFLGKVLIEKLLRSCPKIGNIYILLREKKGNSLESRLSIIKDVALFDKLKSENPHALDKLIPVKGDVRDINLGISDDDRKMLIENVNIIYHAAASVRFDDFLRDAIITNIRGTREVVQLATELKNPAIFVHISTTYCNTDKSIIDEELYPPHTDWRNAITIAEEGNETILNSMTLKYINPLPNTYTFTKSLAEHVVNDLCKGKIPAIIVRPSIVVSTLEDPMPGWIDNFNGPVGVIIAGGKGGFCGVLTLEPGVIRTMLANDLTRADYVPVDVCVRHIIIATHQSGVNRNINEVEVYNCSQFQLLMVTIKETIEMGEDLLRETPFENILWYPRNCVTRCWYKYFIEILIFHMIPMFFLDMGLRLAGKKPMFFKLQRKIYVATCVLSYFIDNSWIFRNSKLFSLMGNLTDEDKRLFDIRTTLWTGDEKYVFFKNAKIGAGKYLLNEDITLDRKRNLRNLKRLWYLDMFVRSLFFLCLFWLIVLKVDIIQIFCRATEKYIRTL